MNWLDQLATAVKRKGDEIPKDWLPSREAAKRWGISRARASNRLNAAVKLGLAERKLFRVWTDKGLKAIYHYGPPCKRAKNADAR